MREKASKGVSIFLLTVIIVAVCYIYTVYKGYEPCFFLKSEKIELQTATPTCNVIR